jgi:predicted ATPase/class 3 adenylate cyclase
MSAKEPPSGVVTFLFTDIEGSTRRWEANADAMRVALAAHDEVLRTAIEGHGGSLFKHTGDGVCAAFASPRSAVDAAVAAQRELELPVRMGIATGEAELRDGDYFGAVLNRAARVMAAGHGGQILLVESTASLLSGVDLVDLGPRRLRDLPTPVGMFQVRAPDLRADFPPLRALDTSPGNLRFATSSFIGRESELDEVQAAVKTHRLVTLTGVGGVGKTRLAVEVGSRLADEFPDGVWLFELAAVTDPASVPDAVAAVLGIAQQPGMSVSDSVAAALEGRLRLLVFDNCEHVRDAAADLIEAILARSATVTILATSREGLGVADEQLRMVPSLGLGAGIDSAAVDLFVERARSVASGFSMATTDEVEAVIEICRRLDGIPLAIELAASRLLSMTVAELRDRLDDRFRLLVGSRRGLERHQTLRHAVAWSYDHLDDAEKALLARCSVFSGGFDLPAACAVADCRDDLATLDLLDALVRKSLVVADRTSERTRFSMLETIRQFAEEQLVASGAAPEVRTAHARYFAGREADIMSLWDSPRQREAYTWFGVELANLRTAFRWAAEHDDLDTAVAIAIYATFLGLLVEQYEPVAWAEEVIGPAREVDHPRLAQLCVLAAQCHAAGRVDDAVGYLDASHQLTERGDFDKVPYELQSSTGIVYSHAGQSDRWADVCRRVIAAEAGPLTITRACLVMALYFLGEGDDARVASEGLLAASDATHNPMTACFALLAHGLAYHDADPVAAYDALHRALTVAGESGNRQMESAVVAVMLLWMVAATETNPIHFFEYLTVAIHHYDDSGNVANLRNPLAIFVGVLDRLGHHEQAATISGFAASAFTLASYRQLSTTITHLRDVLGDQTYESLARKGETMTMAAIATYAYDQIDQAKRKLNAASK